MGVIAAKGQQFIRVLLRVRMKHRTLLASASVGIFAILIAIQGPVAASADEPNSTHTALVGQMVFVPGDASGPDPMAVAEVREAAAALVPVEVPDGLTDEEETRFIANEASELVSDGELGGDLITPFATNTVVGNCGWSSVTLEDVSGIYVGYYQGRFGLDRPGTTFTMNEHVWDPSFWDFSSWVWTDTGNLGGGTSWSDSFTFSVDAQTNYSAELDGEVYVGNGWCITTGAQVNNVFIS